MRFFSYQFQPQFWSTLLALAGFSLFASLAIWQMNRANEKEHLQTSVEQRASLQAVSLSSVDPDIKELRFRKVTAQGLFEKGNDILLDNIVYQGTAGYYLYSLLKLKNREERVLVNRGWLPMGRTRDELPAFVTPEDEVVVHGVAAKPRSKPVVMGNVDKPDIEHEQRWLYLDLDYMAHKTGHPVMPFVIRMDANDNWGYVRDWPRFDTKISMHIGYAIQWAVFAIIVLVVYVAVNLKKTNRSNRLE